MTGLWQRLGYLAGRGKKLLAGLVGAIVSLGGIAVLAPDLSASWQARITAVVTLLAVWLGPANTPKRDAS